MILEAALAYAHLAAVLAMVVFSTSQAALLRPEWLNPAAVQRLARVNRIYLATLLALLLTGLLRMVLGMKGAHWYGTQPLLWAKLAGLLLLAWAAVAPGRAYARWSAPGAVLPAADEVTAVRLQVMRASHGMLVIPLLAGLLARGVGTVG
jgi:putative membrane protein